MWRDRFFWTCIASGIAFWALLASISTVQWNPAWPLDEPFAYLRLAVLLPVLEELIFRGALQPYLARHLGRLPGPVSAANLATSAVFTALHFFYHPPLWAAAVMLPSLAFGHFRDRYGTLTLPVALHVFYNAGYYWIFGA